MTINSISLALTTSSEAGQAGNPEPSAFVLTSYLSFDEASATWGDPQGTAGDDAAGGGTPGTVLSSLLFNPVTETSTVQTFASSSAFTTAAEAALGAPDNMLNLLLYNPGAESYWTGDNTSYNNDYIARFISENAPIVGTRPELILDYSAVPEPATSVIAMLGAGLLAWKRRR